MRNFLSFCAIAFLLVGSAFGAPRSYTATKAQRAPVLDGKFNDACWKSAKWQSDFLTLGTVKPAKEQTKFAVCYDRDNLYIAAICIEPEMDKLVKAITKRDGRIWKDDVLEIFISPDRSRIEYYYFVCNAIGTRGDAKMSQGGFIDDFTWNGDWNVVTSETATGWQVEVRIPLYTLGINATVNDTWTFNLAREEQGIKELSSFAAIGGIAFQQPSQFALLKGMNIDYTNYCWDMSANLRTSVIDKSRVNIVPAFNLTNHTGRTGAVTLKTALVSPSGKRLTVSPMTATFTDSQMRILRAPAVAVAEFGNYRVEMSLYLKGNDTPLRVDFAQLKVNSNALTVKMTVPCYRSSLYATQTIDAVRLKADLHLERAQWKGKTLKAAITPHNGGKPLVVAEVKNLQKSSVTVALPLKRRPAVGKYTCVLRLTDGQQILASANVPLTVLPPPKKGNEVRFRKDGMCMVNGKPFFPFGYMSWLAGRAPWREMDMLKQFENDGFNSIYMTTPREDKDNDLMFIPPGLGFWEKHIKPGWDKMSEEKREKVRNGVAAFIERYQDHPNFLGYTIADEPECRNIPGSGYEEKYRIHLVRDPYHPVLLPPCSVKGIKEYRNSGDLLIPHRYLHPIANGGLPVPMRLLVAEQVDTMRELFGKDRPIWWTPQCFNYGDSGRENERAPSFREMRCQIYLRITRGVTGLFFFASAYTSNYPSLRIGMPWLASETRYLMPVLTAEALSVKVSVKPASAFIYTMVKDVNSHRYVIAVNADEQPAQATLTVAGLKGKRLRVISEGRTVKIVGGVIKDHFEQYQTHIYTTDLTPEPTKRMTVAALDAAVEEAEKAQIKPGNLAHESRGVKVIAKPANRNRANRVNDGWHGEGMLTGCNWGVKKTPATVTMKFPKHELMGKVAVYGRGLRDLELLWHNGREWVRLAGVTKNRANPVTFSFAPIKTDRIKLRVLNPPVLGAGSMSDYKPRGISVHEVEVYAPDKAAIEAWEKAGGAKKQPVTSEASVPNPRDRFRKKLVGWWRFDDEDDKIVSNSSGKKFHGVAGGNATLPKRVDGIHGKAIHFQFDKKNKKHHFVRVPISGSLRKTKALSLIVWIKPDIKKDKEWRQNIVCNMGDSSPKNGYHLSLKYGRLLFGHGSSVDKKKALVLGPHIRSEFWHHVGITCDHKVVRMYVNGKKVKEQPVAGVCNLSANYYWHMTIGNYIVSKDAYPYTGMMDDLEIYSIALPDEAMKQLTENNEY